MTMWLIRRFLQAGFVILAMTVIVFIGVSVIGDPMEMLVAPDATQKERLEVAAALGLDRPLWQQYFTFLSGLAQGDFGRSFIYGEPALQVILTRLPATLELAFTAIGMSVLVGVPLGLYAGLYPNAKSSKAIMAGSIIGFSLPTFWVGLMLIVIFAVELGWLPASGRGDTVSVLGLQWSFLTLDGWSHLLLPALNLALFKVSLILRLVRAGVREVMPEDYVKFARAKGLSEGRVIFVHVLKNLMIPVVTIIGLEFGSVIAFSVVTETIFSWPGMGKLIIESINLLDRPVIVAYLMIIVLLFVVINLIVDLLYTVLDPRVRIRTGA
ncbi:ABC transporter permease [Marinovum sp.]|uniref:ABC transporter permease n=1 Tax=Marinovum sp. TaxID=2024839 RepID=UPI002B270711|nr:ABC transporter permease [Marinovum sp.]